MSGGSNPPLVFVMIFLIFGSALAVKLGAMKNKALNQFSIKKEDDMDKAQKTYRNASMFELAQMIVIGLMLGDFGVSALLT